MSCEKTSDSSVKLTVVIIGRNEERFIAKSLRSALAAAPRLPGVEVIFVDSASTDRSVEIAKQFPIRILQLRPEWPLCVAAGRYTGFSHSRGEYVLFLDGDAEIKADWLVQAVGFLDRNTTYGAVAGVLDEMYVDADGVPISRVSNVMGQDMSKDQYDCKSLGGIALYRRLSLERAGTVNPHLPTSEDDELCLRIRNRGFPLARIPGLMAIKYTENRDTVREILRRSRTQMYDYGAVARYSAQYGSGLQYCWDNIPYVLSFALTGGLFLLSVPLASYFNLAWLPALAAALLFLVVAAKKGSIRLAVLSFLVRAVSTYRTVVSFARTKPKPVEAYPTDVIEVR